MKQRHKIQAVNAKGWVVFSNNTDLFWLRFLKRGYRHCFVILNDGQRWISFDPMAHYSEIIVHDIAPDFDMPQWLAAREHTVMEVPQSNICIKAAPLAFLNCVESVKRVLGIHAFWVFTPWQLYTYLKRSAAPQSDLKQKFQFQHDKETIHGKHNIPA